MTKAELVTALKALKDQHERDMSGAESRFYAETQRITDAYVAKAQAMAKASGFTSQARGASTIRGGGGVRFHGAYDLTKVK